METSKEMLMKILDKMRENVENGRGLFDDVQRRGDVKSEWVNESGDSMLLGFYEYRIKPETITLKNGVTIPKPFDLNGLKDNDFYYVPSCCNQLIVLRKGFDIDKFGINIFYQEKEQAVEASKLLFGIEG